MGKWRYGVILDAGSSGTRVYVYKWLNPTRARKDASIDGLHTLPKLITHKNWTKKTHPGVSTFGTKPTEVGAQHLAPLIEHALSHVPSHAVADTPFFLLATAGVRLLPDTQRTQLLHEICSYTRKNTKFQLPDCDVHIQAISGETEGLYGWIAANYLLGGFDNPEDHAHGKGHHTYGFLDMGGASAQIAFAPNATEAERHANDLQLLRLRTIDGVAEEYRVFVTTWLGFGVNEARRRYVKALEDAVGGPDVKEIPDPCLPAGLKLTLAGAYVATGGEHEPHLLGTGKFAECIRQTYPLLDKDKPCLDSPCLLGGRHVPAIDFDVNHFVGVSEYWHTTQEIFGMSQKDKSYNFKSYQQRVNDFCSQPWKDIEGSVKNLKWGKKVDEKTAREVCFKASWLINVLHDGIGIPRVGVEMNKGHTEGGNITTHLIESAKSKGFLDPFQAVNQIQGVEVSWTLGKMVLYASSQIPSSEAGYEPVGFGSNIPGIAVPTDFQFPGGKVLELSDDLADLSPDTDIADGQDWHDTLFRDSPRRVPGFILFMLIIFFAIFLIIGRERRNNFYAKVCGLINLGRRQPRTGIASGRFGKYDRVIDDDLEGAAGEYELPPYLHSDDGGSDHEHSDSTEGASSSRAGKTPGWATPTLSVGINEEGSPAKRGYFAEHTVKPLGVQSSSALGMGHAWAAGLVLGRTDSRDRLTPSSRSRPGSPGRRSPGFGFKESVD